MDLNNAHMELQIMNTLSQMPMTPSELQEALSLPERRLRTVLADLREAECIERIAGTHLMALRLLDNRGT